MAKNILEDTWDFVSDPFTGASGVEAAKDAMGHELSGLANSDALLKEGYDSTIAQNKLGLDIGSNTIQQMNSGLNNGTFDTQVQSFQGNTQFGEQQPGAYQGKAFDFKADPGYAFRLKEAQDSLTAGAAARGSVFSGDTLDALARKTGEVASQEVGNAYNRFNTDRNFEYNKSQDALGQFNTNRSAFQNSLDSNRGQFNTEQTAKRQSNNERFDRLSSLAGLYTNAVNNNSRAGSEYTQGIAGNAVSAGQARGNSRIAEQNARTQGQQNIGSGIKYLADMGKSFLGGG